MSAPAHEQEFAQTNGVKIKHWAKPARLIGEGGRLRAAEFEYTGLDGAGKFVGTGERFTLAPATLCKAIGQTFVPDPLANGAQQALDLKGGRIAVNAERQTSLPGVYA